MNAKQLISAVTASAFWLVIVIFPVTAAAQPQFYIAPVSGANGGIDGVSVGLSVPVNLTGRKIAEPTREQVLMASAKHTFSESTEYDHQRENSQAMGNKDGYTSKEAFLTAREAGETNADGAQYRASLERIGVKLADDAALTAYFSGLEWVKNANAFEARVGRLIVTRASGSKRLDTGSVKRDVEAGEFMLVDISTVPPRPIILGDCGNVAYEVIGMSQPPAAAVTPTPQQQEPRTVTIVPTAPLQKQQAQGYGMFASQQPAQQLSPAAYGGTTVVVSQTMNVQREKKGHAGAWIVGIGLVLIAGAVVYLATRKSDTNINVNVDDDDTVVVVTPTPTPTPTPIPTPEPHPPEPPVDPPPVEPPPDEVHPPEPTP
jgi:hypothetical protein